MVRICSQLQLGLAEMSSFGTMLSCKHTSVESRQAFPCVLSAAFARNALQYFNP